MDKIQLMKEKIELLNKAAKAYYQENREIMSNYEYDRLYDELVELEKETGTVLSNSPSVRVGYELLSALPKERHEKPMLSLDEAQGYHSIESMARRPEGLLSWKLDDLTLVLTYRGGHLKKRYRGNGEVGEVVTNSAGDFKNIPLSSRLRRPDPEGEAVMLF